MTTSKNIIRNDYPSLEGRSPDDYTPRQKRVASVAFIDTFTGVCGKDRMTRVTLLRKNGTFKTIAIKLTGKEKFLINELLLEFLEARRSSKRSTSETLSRDWLKSPYAPARTDDSSEV